MSFALRITVALALAFAVYVEAKPDCGARCIQFCESGKPSQSSGAGAAVIAPGPTYQIEQAPAAPQGEQVVIMQQAPAPQQSEPIQLVAEKVEPQPAPAPTVLVQPQSVAPPTRYVEIAAPQMPMAPVRNGDRNAVHVTVNAQAPSSRPTQQLIQLAPPPAIQAPAPQIVSLPAPQIIRPPAPQIVSLPAPQIIRPPAPQIVSISAPQIAPQPTFVPIRTFSPAISTPVMSAPPTIISTPAVSQPQMVLSPMMPIAAPRPAQIVYHRPASYFPSFPSSFPLLPRPRPFVQVPLSMELRSARPSGGCCPCN